MENIKTTTTKLPENYHLYDADNRFPDLRQALEVHHANIETLRQLNEQLRHAVCRIDDHSYAVRILDNLHDDFCYGSDGTTKKVVKFMQKYCGVYDAGECVPYELEKSLDVLRDAQKKNCREIISLEDQIKTAEKQKDDDWDIYHKLDNQYREKFNKLKAAEKAAEEATESEEVAK